MEYKIVISSNIGIDMLENISCLSYDGFHGTERELVAAIEKAIETGEGLKIGPFTYRPTSYSYTADYESIVIVERDAEGRKWFFTIRKVAYLYWMPIRNERVLCLNGTFDSIEEAVAYAQSIEIDGDWLKYHSTEYVDAADLRILESIKPIPVANEDYLYIAQVSSN